jgi:phosphatidylglycerol:prolipoprotein diacylglycerol transferase
MRHPIEILKLWDGGMSFHGGVIGTSLGIFYFAHKEKLSWLRIHDYVACCVPFGLFFGRLANFVNQELWGAVTTVPWAVRFQEINDFGQRYLGPPRHPSQLYEAFLEGIVLFAILAWMFWKTKARYEPGKLVGAFLFFYGCFRFAIEFIREPDQQLVAFTQATGLHMGQWLSLPMILGGLYLMLTARKRRVRVEATAGTASVA